MREPDLLEAIQDLLAELRRDHEAGIALHPEERDLLRRANRACQEDLVTIVLAPDLEHDRLELFLRRLPPLSFGRVSTPIFA